MAKIILLILTNFSQENKELQTFSDPVVVFTDISLLMCGLIVDTQCLAMCGFSLNIVLRNIFSFTYFPLLVCFVAEFAGYSGIIYIILLTGLFYTNNLAKY